MTLDSVFIPAQKKSSRDLMVVLHGLGDSVEGFRWLPEALQLPWLNYLLVNAPDAYFGGFSWFDFALNPAPGIERSRKLLFQLLATLPEKGFSHAQTSLFGFSQGCLMSVDVAARYPYPLAGIIGMSGFIHEPNRLLEELSPAALQQRFLITHGFFDPILPCEMVRQQVLLLQRSGLQIEWHDFMKAHTFGGEAEIKLIRDFLVKAHSLHSPEHI